MQIAAWLHRCAFETRQVVVVAVVNNVKIVVKKSV